MLVALAMLCFALAVHAAITLTAHDLAAEQAQGWVQRHRIAPRALALHRNGRERVEMLRQADELVYRGVLQLVLRSPC